MSGDQARYTHAGLTLESGFAQSDQRVGDHVDNGVPRDGDHPSPVRICDRLVKGIQSRRWTSESPVDQRDGPGQWGQRVVQKGCHCGVFPRP